MGRCAYSSYRRCASDVTSSVQPHQWHVFVPYMHRDCDTITIQFLMQPCNLFASGFLSVYTRSLNEDL